MAAAVAMVTVAPITALAPVSVAELMVADDLYIVGCTLSWCWGTVMSSLRPEQGLFRTIAEVLLHQS